MNHVLFMWGVWGESEVLPWERWTKAAALTFAVALCKGAGSGFTVLMWTTGTTGKISQLWSERREKQVEIWKPIVQREFQAQGNELGEGRRGSRILKRLSRLEFSGHRTRKKGATQRKGPLRLRESPLIPLLSTATHVQDRAVEDGTWLTAHTGLKDIRFGPALGRALTEYLGHLYRPHKDHPKNKSYSDFTLKSFKTI